MLSLVFTVLTSLSSLASAELKLGYIGDSQSASSHGMMAKLLPEFRRAGYTTYEARAVCGAKINDYLDQPVKSRCNKPPDITHMNISSGVLSFPAGAGETRPISSIISKVDAVVIALGDNHLVNTKEAGALAQKLAKTVLKAKKKCVWIGPAAVPNVERCQANLAAKKAVSESLKAALSDPKFVSEHGTCRFIDSFSATVSAPLLSDDCLHYENYSPWARAIRARVRSALELPDPPPPPAIFSTGSP